MSADPRTLECLDRLIGFDTVSRNSNLACIDWARAHLEAHGARTWTDYNTERTKANLYATFGEGPGGIVLSGHVDVVPVDGQPWTSDPFKATIREGRVYGRGATDMKGFDAVVLGHAEHFGKARLKEPIHVALTYDEELGCTGIPKLIKAMGEWGMRPRGAIIGEPTSMRLVSAHKGGRVYRCEVTGRPQHSSLTHLGVNAIEYASRIIAKIQEIRIREQTTGMRDEGFDVPFTTVSTNLIGGGNGGNIVPASAWFQFDYRYVPGYDPAGIINELQALAEELNREMQAIAPETGIAFHLINAIPALDAKPQDEVFGLALSLLDDKRIEKVAYGTEASFFQEYGVPSIVCGPGSIAQAHQPDEYVELSQLAACDRFVEGVVAKLSA